MAQKNSVPVKVEKLSGFDKSHKVLTTLQCGTITPLLTDELMPGSKVDLKINIAAQLPPLASDTYARACIKSEAFFVPHRLLYGGFQKFMTGDKMTVSTSDGEGGFDDDEGTVLGLRMFVQQSDFIFGGLLDNLGCRYTFASASNGRYINPYPVLAYHKIWDDWYRNSLIQKPCFINTVSNYPDEDGRFTFVDNLPWTTNWDSDNGNVDIIPGKSGYQVFKNGVGLFDLHQRNFDSDYFTNATPTAQEGNAQTVTVSSSKFSIESLRIANSLQKFAERNNLAGTQYVDWLRANYGISPSDGIAQRSMYLGSAKFNIYNKGVYSAADTTTGDWSNKNPFIASVGGQVGSAYAEGSDFIIRDFTATEPGTLMVLITLCPEGVSYSSGANRLFRRYNTGNTSDRLDLANAMLAGTGNQPIYNDEISTVAPNAADAVFGYTERYADWKTMCDRVSGGFREYTGTTPFPVGQVGLSHFVLQRTISGVNTINSTFLEIPKNFMDNITLMTNSVSTYGCSLDSYLEYKVAMPLPEYCQPSLEASDEEHQNTIYVSRNGSKL